MSIYNGTRTYTQTLTQEQGEAAEQTQGAADPARLVLRLSSRENPLETLIKKLSSSEVFSPEEIKQMKELVAQIIQLESPLDVQTALCYFLFNFIHPKFNTHSQKAIFLLSIEDEINALL